MRARQDMHEPSVKLQSKGFHKWGEKFYSFTIQS
jgi:hypothetical protein